jgi:hypothetical protein
MDEQRERDIADAAGGPPAAPPDGPPAAPPDGPPAAPPAGPPAAPKGRRWVLGVATGAAVVAVAILLKLALPLLIGTAVSGVLGNVFGGAYSKLPADQQQALQRRVDAAIGTRLDGVPDAEQSTRIEAMVRSGLPRLSDAPLVEKVHLTVKVLSATDEATCARIARGIATGVADKDATLKALEAVDVDSIGRWYDINVQAIEADAASTPVRAVDPNDSERILTGIASGFSTAEAEQVGALYRGGEVSDGDACGGLRAFYRHVETLPAGDLAVAALYDVAP